MNKKSFSLVTKLLEAYPGYYTKQSSYVEKLSDLVKLWDGCIGDLSDQQIAVGIEKMICFILKISYYTNVVKLFTYKIVRYRC